MFSIGFFLGGMYTSFVAPGSMSGKSSCGSEFDAYMKQSAGPFPYDRNDPVSHRVEIWNGRKARIYTSPSKYRTATIQSMIQRNKSPYSSETTWLITLKFDDETELTDDKGTKYGPFEVGDVVQIHDRPKKYDKSYGTVTAVNSLGNYKIHLHSGETVTSVAPDNLTLDTFKVHRMNVTGGGVIESTLTGTSHLDSLEKPTPTQISLEWIDSPTPPVPSDLFPSTVKIKCPICRAVEPNNIAFDDTVQLHVSTEPCPVCLESKLPSRTFQCSHTICDYCFKTWRDRGNSQIPSSVTPPHRDPASLQRVRDRAFQRLQSTLPHTFLNGTATREGGRTTRQTNNKTRIDQAMSNFKDQIGTILSELDDLANHYRQSPGPDGRPPLTEDESLTRYWGKLREISIHIFCEKSIVGEFVSNMQSMASVEILMKVMEERKDSIIAGVQSLGVVDKARDGTTAGPLDPQKYAEGFVEQMFAKCCNRIGELYEDDREARSAIHWYERALLHSRKAQEMQGNSAECKADLSTLYNNLGLAQRRAGLLTASMDSYDQAIELCPSNTTASGNKGRLQLELVEWIGTSGDLPPP